MSMNGLHRVLRAGRICFLQVPLGTSPFLLCKKSTSVTQGHSASTEEHCKETCAIDDLYSSEQRSAVLHLLNSASKEELTAMKPMQGRKSANIVEYRDKHGPFENLQNLLEVPLFQYETTVKVCNFILQNRMKEKGERKPRPVSVMKYITPDVDREKLKAADDIVSVVFGTRKIAWAHVDRKLAVLDWQQQDSKIFMKGTYVPAMYLEEISSVVSRFPEADYYVLEKSGRAKVNAASFPVSLHLRTVEAMLYALLHKTFAQDGQPKVLSISRNAVGRYFGLIVGDVRTSGIDLVKEFISDSLTQAEASRVRFPSHQIFHYRNALSSPQKRDEELCDSLLQAVAFCELFLQNKMT